MSWDIAVIGAGYVGMPHAQAFAEAGKKVLLVDVVQPVVDAINRGESHIKDVSSEDLKALVDSGAVSPPFTYLEFGVYEGDSISWWLGADQHPASRFVGFDSFVGLPEDWLPDIRKGHFTTGGQPPAIRDPRCSFNVGWFRDTLPEFLKRTDPVFRP